MQMIKRTGLIGSLLFILLFALFVRGSFAQVDVAASCPSAEAIQKIKAPLRYLENHFSVRILQRALFCLEYLDQPYGTTVLGRKTVTALRQLYEDEEFSLKFSLRRGSTVFNREAKTLLIDLIADQESQPDATAVEEQKLPTPSDPTMVALLAILKQLNISLPTSQQPVKFSSEIRKEQLATLPSATPTAIATPTPSATPAVPATPAQPATPSSGSGGSGSTTSAVPATSASPATPAVPVASASTPSTTPAVASTTTSTAVTVPPPVFTITSPNGGEQWTAGNTYTITWTSAGTNVSTVNIDLHKSDSYSAAIVSNVSNNGNVSWTVPATITAGNDYKIRIYNNAYYNNFDESNSAFSVTVPVAAPGTPPIGYWKFDGSGNNEIVNSPNAVTVGNAAIKTSGGKFGGYLYMPGSNDYAKIPYSSIFDLPDSFSIEFWFRQRSNQSFNQNLVSKGTPTNNYNFNIARWLWNQYNFGPVIAGHTAANTGFWTQPSNPNQLAHNDWHHVAFTKSPSYHAYYLDGNLTGSKDITATSNTEYGGPAKTPAVDIVIGNPAPDTDIDNLRIYNYGLSRGEVLYNWQEVATISALPVTPPPAPTATPTGTTTPTSTSSAYQLQPQRLTTELVELVRRLLEALRANVR